MKRFLRLFPILTVLGGVAAGVLRYLLLSNINDRGLLPVGTPAEILMYTLSGLLLLGLAGVLLRRGRQDFRTYLNFPVQAFGCAVMAAVMAILMRAETVPVFFLFRLTTTVSFLLLAFYRLKKARPPLILFALISLSMMMLCFAQYRVWSQHTQLSTYLFPAMAALLTALYSLDYGYLEVGETSCKRTLFLNQAALFFNLTCVVSGDWLYHSATILWLLSGLFLTPYTMVLPETVKQCITMLEQAGYTAYAVGGCVRDAVMGRKPHDYDLCTSATPEEICQVFREFKLIHNGEKHGTVGVALEDGVYEITTYRTESDYADHRHPDAVEFVDNIEQDLSRRDFTVNAMAFHPASGYFDPYGGKDDLLCCTLRTVGDPQTRFREDALRILRGVRFACRFRLDVEAQTLAAMEKLAPLQENLARERVYSELTQILCHVQKGDLTRFAPVLLQTIPELQETVGFQQHSVHHAYDVFTHIEQVVVATEPHPALRWAALLHDIGKPQTFQKDEKGQGHFYGHAQISAQLADQILKRMKASNALREQVIFLISHHMDTLSADEVQLSKKISKYGIDSLKKLVALQMADDAAKGTKKTNRARHRKILQLLEKIEKQNRCLQIRDLAIDGHDLLALGFAESPELGQCQKELLELVLDGKLHNEKEALLQKANEILNR